MANMQNSQELRSRAEARLASWSPDPAVLPGSMLELVHELQVHQIELQLQNDALRDAQRDLETAREKYRELYELAPVACLSVGPDTHIVEANRACGQLLALAPMELLGQRLSKFVAREYVDAFARFRRELLASRTHQSCTLDLVVAGRRRNVRIEGAQNERAPGALCLLAIIDLDEPKQLRRNPLDLEAEPVELDAVVEKAAGLLRRLLGTDVQLELDLRAGNARVRIDRSQLDQILFNLASNAHHAMPAGGRVRIESRVIESNTLRSADRAEPEGQPRVLLAISDTGLGMDDEEREQALQPLRASKRPSSGGGFGLSLISNAVAQSAGHFELQSTPGHGTTVFVSWPRWEPHSQAATPATAPARRARLGPTTHVLLVDDDRLVRMAIRRYLEHAGCKVVEAESGEAALELLGRDPTQFQLLVADVVLPDFMGTDLARSAQQRCPGITPLFVSGHTRPYLIKRGWLESDATSLHKPFSAVELREALGKVLESRHVSATPND